MTEKKPRLVEVTDPEDQIYLVEHFNDPGVPYPYVQANGVYADADELRAWREARSYNDGGSEHG